MIHDGAVIKKMEAFTFVPVSEINFLHALTTCLECQTRFLLAFLANILIRRTSALCSHSCDFVALIDSQILSRLCRACVSYATFHARCAGPLFTNICSDVIKQSIILSEIPSCFKTALLIRPIYKWELFSCSIWNLRADLCSHMLVLIKFENCFSHSWFLSYSILK